MRLLIRMMEMGVSSFVSLFCELTNFCSEWTAWYIQWRILKACCIIVSRLLDLCGKNTCEILKKY